MANKWPLNKIYLLRDEDGELLNPRHRYDGLGSLAQSIDQTGGILEPLVLGPVQAEGPNKGKRPLFAGHRRVKAMRQHLHWNHVEVPFVERVVDGIDDILAVMIAANNGVPLKPTEIGKVVLRLTTEFGWTPERIAQWCPMVKSPADAVLFGRLVHDSTPQQIRDDVDSGKMAWSTWRTLSTQSAAIKQEVVSRIRQAQEAAGPDCEVRPTGQRVKTAIKVARGADVARLLEDESLLKSVDDIISMLESLREAMPWAPNIRAQMEFRLIRICDISQEMLGGSDAEGV